MERIVILGSTGSIGTQALDIIENDNSFKVVGLSCGKNISVLEDEIKRFKPSYVSTKDENRELIKKYPDITFMYGDEALLKMASLDECDTVLNSLVGSCGLLPTLEAIKNHKKVLLSNKETLVVGGDIVKRYLKEYDGTLYPIDSEHSSLWELIDEYGKENIDEITITASGGPFRDMDKEKLKDVTVKDALNHPNWKMGSKITIDSATMMNKGFEVMEAYHLFGFPLDKTKTIINMESLVHSMVKLKDGRLIKGVDRATMENPIRRALYYPKINYMKETYDESLFHFREIDMEKYPCLSLAYIALDEGGLSPCILNAANEASVNLFLNGKIGFTDIYEINKKMMIKFKTNKELTIENIKEYDTMVKEYVLNNFGE